MSSRHQGLTERPSPETEECSCVWWNQGHFLTSLHRNNNNVLLSQKEFRPQISTRGRRHCFWPEFVSLISSNKVYFQAVQVSVVQPFWLLTWANPPSYTLREMFTFQNSKDDDRSLALLDSTPPSTPRALRLDRMTLTHPGAMLDDPREFRR